MTDAPLSFNKWLAAPMEPDVSAAIDRIRRAPDVRHVAIMPDVHLATDVCVGTVVGTTTLLYPQAVGGDIGCGMLALRFDADADLLRDATAAGHLLARLAQCMPPTRRHRRAAIGIPSDVTTQRLSHPALETILRNEGTLQFATLGSGNHFVELQADDENRLWLLLHSGSRAMGQAIRDHHLARAGPVGGGLMALDASDGSGQAYAADVAWARAYARASRQAMSEIVTSLLAQVTGAHLAPDLLIEVDHNHVALEEHHGRRLWVHRKGAMPAGNGQAGVLPGSMGTVTFHVEGRGCPASLRSSAHGAGRAMSRHAARERIPRPALFRQMNGVWWDYRQAAGLTEEAPSAYKDIRAVMRAQRDLVKVVRALRPLLNYKGR